MPERVFVYGSLRRGGAYSDLMRTASFLGHHISEPGYSLYDLGDYPAAVAEGQGRLAGEVYSIDAETFRQLDELEEYPAVYTRSQIATPWGDAWIYLMMSTPTGAPLIASGDWTYKT